MCYMTIVHSVEALRDLRGVLLHCSPAGAVYEGHGRSILVRRCFSLRILEKGDVRDLEGYHHRAGGGSKSKVARQHW